MGIHALPAKKSLGQHFLNSPSVLAKIVAAANIQKGEPILEIGPGTGVLTKALIQAGARIIAVEKDSRVKAGIDIQDWARMAEESGYFTFIEDDILSFDPARVSLKDGEYALVANIPYYITGAILEKFLESAPRPNRMVLLVQKEVAERIVARDGKESILSISVKAFGTPRIIAHVPRGAFTPAPNVDSSILAIGDIHAATHDGKKIDSARFFKIVRAGFAHKRKYLIRNLETIASDEALINAWKKLGLDKKARAESISPDQWKSIFTEIGA